MLKKRGRDEVRDVTATVAYNGEDEQIQHRDSMSEDEALVFVFQQALRDYQAEYKDRQTTILGLARSWPHTVNEHIQWTTARGTPKLHDQNPAGTFELYFDR